jgi:hypothetical protein
MTNEGIIGIPFQVLVRINKYILSQPLKLPA